MANNLTANVPAILIATQTVSFSSIGITQSNINVIYKVGNPLLSYDPSKTLNAISGFENGSGYYVLPKTNMDLSAYTIPPVPGSITTSSSTTSSSSTTTSTSSTTTTSSTSSTSSSSTTTTTTQAVAIVPGLIGRAQTGTQSPELFHVPSAINEFDLRRYNGNWYLFYDNRQGTTMRKGPTIASLATAEDVEMAYLRYPTLNEFNGKWSMYGYQNSTEYGMPPKVWEFRSNKPENTRFSSIVSTPTIPTQNRWDFHARTTPDGTKVIAGYVSTYGPGYVDSMAKAHVCWSTDGQNWTDDSEVMPGVRYPQNFEQDADTTFFFERMTGKLFCLWAGHNGGVMEGLKTENLDDDPNNNIAFDPNAKQVLLIIECNPTTGIALPGHVPTTVLEPNPNIEWHNRHKLPRLFNPVYFEVPQGTDLEAGEYIFFAHNSNANAQNRFGGWGYIKLATAPGYVPLPAETIVAEPIPDWTFNFEGNLLEANNRTEAVAHNFQLKPVLPVYNAGRVVFNKDYCVQVHGEVKGNFTIELEVVWDGFSGVLMGNVPPGYGIGPDLDGPNAEVASTKVIVITAEGTVIFGTDRDSVGWGGAMESGTPTLLKFVKTNGNVAFYKNNTLVSTLPITGTASFSTLGGYNRRNLSYTMPQAADQFAGKVGMLKMLQQ